MWCSFLRCGANWNLFFEMCSADEDARGDVNCERPERVVKKPKIVVPGRSRGFVEFVIFQPRDQQALVA